MEATEHLDHDSIYRSMTRPHFKNMFTFATQIPQVLDTKNINAHVTPLLAEQALSDVIEMDPAELSQDAFNKAIYSNV